MSHPLVDADLSILPLDSLLTYVANTGLTKREWFAAIAMQGLLASERGYRWPGDDVAKMAVQCADDLVQQLNVEL